MRVNCDSTHEAGRLSPVCLVSDSKVDGAYMGPIWGRHVLDGLHVDPMNLAIRGDAYG